MSGASELFQSCRGELESIPYSAIFSRRNIFADCAIVTFAETILAGEGRTKPDVDTCEERLLYKHRAM